MESCHSVLPLVTKVPRPCHRLLPNKIYSTLGHLITILEELNSTEDFQAVIQKILTERPGDDPCLANSQTSTARLDPDTLIKVFEILGKVNSSIIMMETENDGTKSNSSAAPKSSMLESLGIKPELELALKAMEDKKSTLTQDNMYLVKKLKEFEQKYKPLQEKNRKFLEKNMELTTALRNLKDENNNCVEENKRLKEQLESCRRKSSQLTHQLNQEKMEKAALEMKVNEMEELKKQVSEQDKTITSLKQACAEKDRRMEILQHRKNRRLRMSVEQLSRMSSPNCTLDDDRSLDSSQSSVSAGTAGSDDELMDEPAREEVEKNYRKLMKEHLLMEKSMAQLQGTLGCRTDPQRYNKLKSDLEMDLFVAQCRIETLESALEKQQADDCSWVLEKDQLCAENQSLRERLMVVSQALEEAREQTENLEFLMLESQEGLDKSKQAPKHDAATETDTNIPNPDNETPKSTRDVEEKLSKEITELRCSEAALKLQLEMAEKIQQDYRGHIEGLEEKLTRLLEGKGPEGESVMNQLKCAEKHVVDLEGTMQELQSKVIHLQQEKSNLSEKLSKYKDKSEAQEKSLALTRNEREELLQVKQCKTPDQLLSNRLKLAERGGHEAKERTPRFVHIDYTDSIMLADRGSVTPRSSQLDTPGTNTPRSPLEGYDAFDDFETDTMQKGKGRMFGSESDLSRNTQLSLSQSFLHVDVLREVDKLQKQVTELQEENDVLRYELAQKVETESASGSDSEDHQLIELRETCESLKEKAHSAELAERQYRERLKLAERTINELEASETSLRDKMEEATSDCDKLKKQIVRLQRKIRELKDIQTEKESTEQCLMEKVEFLEEAENVNSRKIDELEETNQVLRQRLELKDELIADVHLVETLKDKVVALETENNELSAKISELEEDGEVLRDNWKKVADEEANRRECLEEKIKVLKSANKDLKSKLKERESDIDLDLSSGPSLASEIDSQTIEQLREKIRELEEELQNVSEQKNSKIESLQESLDNLRQNEVKLSETLTEMECSEKQLKSKIAVLEQSENSHEAASRMLSYEGKLSKLRGSQEDLLARLDSMEEHEDDLKQRLRDMEQTYEKKIESLESEINDYQNQEEELVVAIEAYETKEKQLLEKIEELENIETNLTVRFSQRVEELENNESQLTEKFYLKIDELEKSETELKKKISVLDCERTELQTKLQHIENENKTLLSTIKDLEEKVEDLDNHEKEISAKFTNRIQELEKHEQELMEKVKSLENTDNPLTQENSQLLQNVSSSDNVTIEIANKMESYAKLEKESEQKLTVENSSEFDSVKEEKENFRKELSELKTQLEQQKTEKEELLSKIKESEKEQKSLSEKLKKEEKKRKKSQRSDNLEDYDSLARELVTYKVEVEQLRTENTDLHERLMELDDSEKHLQEKNEELEAEVEKLGQLKEKLNVLQDAEGKFMERINELEEIESKLREKLESQSVAAADPTRQPSLDSAYDSEISKADIKVEMSDKLVGTSDFMEGVMGNSDSGKPVSSMFERIQGLEAENQELSTKLSALTATDAQVRQLSDKVKFLEQSEDSLMERVMELEDQEDQLKRELNKLKRSASSVVDLEDELNELRDREKDLSEKINTLEGQNSALKKSFGLSDMEKNDFAVRLTSLQILYDEEKKKVESLLKGEERLMKSLSSEKKSVKELEQELANTQEKLEEIQTEYEHKLSDCEDSEKRVKDELNKQMREKEVFRKKLQDFEKSNNELEDEIEACKISESRMFHRHQQIMARNQELEGAIVKMKKLIPSAVNMELVPSENSSNENHIADGTLSMSDNPDVVSENPLTTSVFSEDELKLLRSDSEVEDTGLLGAVPLDMLRKMKEFDTREMSYQSKIEELENKNVKLVRKLKVLQSKDKDLKSEIKELQMELLNYRESTSSLRASSSSLDLDKSLSDDGTDSDNPLSDVQDTTSSSVFETGKSNSKLYDDSSRDHLLLTVKLFEKKQSQDAEKISQLEDQCTAFREAVQKVVDIVSDETFESYMGKVDTFQKRATQQWTLEEGICEDLMVLLDSQTSLRQRFEALQTSEETLRLAMAKTEIQMDKLHRDSAEKVKELEAQIYVLAKLGDKYPPTADQTVPEPIPKLEPVKKDLHAGTGKKPDNTEDTLWQKLEKEAFRVTSPRRSLLLETSKTINIDVAPTPQNDICYLGQSETIKVNVPPSEEFLEKIEREAEQTSLAAMMDKPEDVLRIRIRELEKLEKHLKQQVYDLEQDRDELHDIARKDKNIIHEQNVRLRELQLSEKNLHVQLQNFEVNENSLYSRLDEVENENLRQADRIRDLEILEGRLKDLVKKYKLDGKILETKSETLESSMQELTAKEENLKQKVHNLESEKSAFSERSEYLQMKVKELESAESDIAQRTKHQENLTQILQNRVAELEMFGANAQQRVVELESINLELSQRLHLAMTENSPLTQHATDLQNRVLDLEAKLKTMQRTDSHLKQENQNLQETEGDLQQMRKNLQMKEVEMQATIHKLEESEAMLKDRVSKLQRNENTLKYRVQELENAGLQAPEGRDPSSSSRDSNKLPRNLEDCQRRVISLQNSNAELLSRLQQYQTVSGTRAMVQLPQAEYQQLQVKAGLLDQTEAQMEQTDRLNASLQQTVTQLREGKDVCGHEVELDVLRKRLEQSQNSVQMLRNPDSRQWNVQGQNVIQPMRGSQGGNVATSMMSLRTMDHIEGQVISLPGEEEWLTIPHGGPHLASGGAVEETISKTQTGSVQSRPTGHSLSRDRMIDDLLQGVKAPGQVESEDRHWRDIELRAPEAGSRDEQWIHVGKATSLYTTNPQWSHRKDEELELGINLPSESESQLYSQNDTDSVRHAPHLRHLNRELHVNSANGSIQAPSAPTLPNSVPQGMGVTKVTDSFVESLSMPASVLDSLDEMSDPSREVLLRNGGPSRGLYNTLPQASVPSIVESVADSGRGTASVSMATSGLTLRERIAHIERQLSTRETDSGRDFRETEPTLWKARVLESNRKLELAEKENKHMKDEINRLEKDLEEKTRLYLILESFLQLVENILQQKNVKNEQEIIVEIEKEVAKTRSALDAAGHRPSDISNDPTALSAEMAKKDRELVAKRNEVDCLMRELRQWQEECRTIEDMRTNALDSLRGLEVEVTELQNADKQLKELKDQFNTLRGQYMRLLKAYKLSAEVHKKLEEMTQEKDNLDIEAAGLRSKVTLLEGQIRVFEEVTQEKTDLVKQVSDLKFKVKDFDDLESEYSTLEEKMLRTSDALNERMRKVEELTEEIFLLRNKISHLEKDNYTLRQSSTASDPVKPRVDDLEHAKSKLQANVAPLRSKIVQLTHLCNEKDVMIKKLVQELKSGSKRSPLLEELFRLENNEDFNHNRLGRSSSQSSLGSGDQLTYLSDTEVLRDSSPRHIPRPRSADVFTRRPQTHRQGVSHLPHIHRNSLPTPSGIMQDTNSLPHGSDFVAIADYDPSMFSRSGRRRLELSLKEGDIVTVTGPLDQNGYFEAEVNGQVGLVPGSYIQPNGPSHRTGRQFGTPGYLDGSPEKITQMYHHLNTGHRSDIHGKTRFPIVNGVANGSANFPSYQGGPPEAPSNFHVDKIIGNSSLMLSWQPLNLDDRGCSNGVKITGFRVYKDNKVLFHPSTSQQSKAVVENIDIHAHHRFGIQTVSVDGQVSELSEIMYEGVEEVTSDENSDTESEMDMSGVIDTEEYKTGPKRTFMGVYDYDPNKNSPQDHPACELSFKAGDVITVYGRQRADGFYHGEINGSRGLVPAFFIEEVPQAPPRTKKSNSKTKGANKDSKPSLEKQTR